MKVALIQKELTLKFLSNLSKNLEIQIFPPKWPLRHRLYLLRCSCSVFAPKQRGTFSRETENGKKSRETMVRKKSSD